MADTFTKEAIIKEVLQDAVEKVKPQVKEAILAAAQGFYAGASQGTYSRTLSILNIANTEPTESWDSNSVTLSYTFDSSEISVNPWKAPWRNEPYEGDPEIAFGVAYDVGYHGGPRPVYVNKRRTGDWTWERTAQSTPIGELIWEYIDNITL